MAISRAQTRKGKRKRKISKVLSEYKRGKLCSGSKKVTSRPQAVAIALSEARKAAKRRA